MLFLAMVIVGIVVAVIYLRARQDADRPGPGFLYARKARLLTANEERFWRALSDACRDRHLLACKVRMADVLDARPFSQAAFNQINRKHFDFVLCDMAATRPLLVIELDDASHRQPDAQRRDAVKDDACRAAGLPILRVPVQQSYDPAYLQGRITEMIAPLPIISQR